jgi:hypothetical protein
MIDILAHITEVEIPGFLLAALVGFAAGVGVMYAMLGRKVK